MDARAAMHIGHSSEQVITIGGRPIRVQSIGSDEPSWQVHTTAIYPDHGITVFDGRGIDDDGVPRQHFWSPPLQLLPRATDAALRLALTGLQELRAPHPRWRNILGSNGLRKLFTQDHNNKKILEAGQRGESTVAVLPTCAWCGLPTGNFCDGFVCMAKDSDDPHHVSLHTVYQCGGPVCSDCERVFGVCYPCSFWAGLPTQLVFANAEEAADW